MENNVTEEDKSSDSKTTGKARIKVKRSRSRLYESVPDDEKSTASSGKEKGQKAKAKSKKTNKQDSINERKDDEDKRLPQANEIVAYYVQWSIGVSVVPIPLLDVVTVLAVQLRMLDKLSDNYGIKFSENRVKILTASLVGSLNSGLIGGKLLVSTTKLVPGIGTFLGITAMSAFSGAVTYALGQVFIQHFESGGTFLDFDPKKVRAYFMAQFEEGKKMAGKKMAD